MLSYMDVKSGLPPNGRTEVNMWTKVRKKQLN